jgi:hypothetical protein
MARLAGLQNRDFRAHTLGRRSPARPLEYTWMAGHPSVHKKQGRGDSSILRRVRQASRKLALESIFSSWNLVSGHDGSIIGGIDPD